MVKKREKKQASGSPLARELKRDDDEAPDFDAYLVSATVHPPYFVFCVQQSKQKQLAPSLNRKIQYLNCIVLAVSLRSALEANARKLSCRPTTSMHGIDATDHAHDHGI